MTKVSSRYGEIPSDWIIEDISTLIDEVLDYRGKTPKKSEQDIPIVGAKIIKNGRIDYKNAEYVSQEVYNRWMTRGFPKEGDVVLTTEGPLGEIAQIDARKVALAQRILTFRVKQNKATNEYLKYFLQSSLGQFELDARATGTTVRGIKQSEFRKLKILIPTEITEMETIGKILSLLDEKIELNHQMNHTLEQMAQAVFKSWFVDFEPFKDERSKWHSEFKYKEELEKEIPIGWEIVKLSELISIKHGYAFKSKYFSENETEFILLTPGNFKIGGGFKLDKIKYYDNSEEAIKQEFMLKKGDLLINMTDLSKNADILGFPAFIPPKTEKIYLHNQRLGKVLIKENELISKECLYCFFKTLRYRHEVLSSATGTTVHHTAPSRIESIFFPLPPKEVMEEFSSIAVPLFERINSNFVENIYLTRLREILLPRLISGKLRIPHPEKFLEELESVI